MIFPWSLSDSKSPRIFGTLLSILSNLYSVVVWMVSILILIYYFPCLFPKPLETAPKAPIIIDITVTFMFYSFDKIQLFSYHFAFFYFHSIVRRNGKSTWWQVQFFLSIDTRTGRLAGIKWSFYILKSQRIVCASFSRRDSDLCIYYLVGCSNYNLLLNSLWITFTTLIYHSCCDG